MNGDVYTFEHTEILANSFPCQGAPKKVTTLISRKKSVGAGTDFSFSDYIVN